MCDGSIGLTGRRASWSGCVVKLYKFMFVAFSAEFAYNIQIGRPKGFHFDFAAQSELLVKACQQKSFNKMKSLKNCKNSEAATKCPANFPTV